MLNINKIIDEVVTIAIDLIKATDTDSVTALSEASANYDVNDTYAIFMNFEPYEYPNNGLWFTFYEKNNGDGWNIEEQDTANLTEESIRYNLKILFDDQAVKECL